MKTQKIPILKNSSQQKTLLIPGVYDCLSALLAKKSGFKALYLSGGALSVSYLGKPDIGLLTLEQVVDTARRIIIATRLPLIVDVDTGFGGEINIKRCVQEMEAVGVAGIQIEDQEFPKRCGHLRGKSVISPNEMVKKIKAAVSTRKNRNFLIIARTDARAVEGVKSAINRALLYRKSGADIIFPEALESKQEFRLFSEQKGTGSLMANMTEFGISPSLTVDELHELGYKMVIFPVTALRRAAKSIEELYRILQKKGQSRSVLKTLQTRDELYELIQYKTYEKREKVWKNQARKIKGNI